MSRKASSYYNPGPLSHVHHMHLRVHLKEHGAFCWGSLSPALRRSSPDAGVIVPNGDGSALSGPGPVIQERATSCTYNVCSERYHLAWQRGHDAEMELQGGRPRRIASWKSKPAKGWISSESIHSKVRRSLQAVRRISSIARRELSGILGMRPCNWLKTHARRRAAGGLQ